MKTGASIPAFTQFTSSPGARVGLKSTQVLDLKLLFLSQILCKFYAGVAYLLLLHYYFIHFVNKYLASNEI